jgi:hypothetical protein
MADRLGDGGNYCSVEDIEEKIIRATVSVHSGDERGSAFFVTPRLLLSCAHTLKGESIQLKWRSPDGIETVGSARVVQTLESNNRQSVFPGLPPWPDLVVLESIEHEAPSIAPLSPTDLDTGTDVQAYGHADAAGTFALTPALLRVAGRRADLYLELSGGEVWKGMSGGSLRTTSANSRVVAVVVGTFPGKSVGIAVQLKSVENQIHDLLQENLSFSKAAQPQSTTSLEPYRQLFLHYFDIHFLAEREMRLPKEALRPLLTSATRLALLAADEVLIPAASYFESDLCREVIDVFAPLFLEVQTVRLVGGGTTVREFADSKLGQYKENSDQFARYAQFCSDPTKILPPLKSRLRSTSEDLHEFLRSQLESGIERSLQGSLRSVDLQLPVDFENRWASLPEKLEGRAVIPDYVLPLLTDSPSRPLQRGVSALINRGYFSSYLAEFGTGIVEDLNYLDGGDSVPEAQNSISHAKFFRVLNETDEIRKLVLSAPPLELRGLRSHPLVAAALERAKILDF